MASPTSSDREKPSLRNYVPVLDLGRGVVIKTNSRSFTLDYGSAGKTHFTTLEGALESLWKTSLQKKMEQRATDIQGLLDAIRESNLEIKDILTKNGWT